MQPSFFFSVLQTPSLDSISALLLKYPFGKQGGRLKEPINTKRLICFLFIVSFLMS